MTQDIEQLVLSVRTDTRGFARDVAAMRGELEGPLAGGVERAGSAIERSLGRAIRRGKMDFDDLKKVALTALGEIASAALVSVLRPQGQAGGGGMPSSLLAGIVGAPGRAHGGPVSGGRPYWVGERGPELFVPSGAGRVEAPSARGRDVRVAISINSPGTSDPRLLERSSRQVARAVRRAVGR